MQKEQSESAEKLRTRLNKSNSESQTISVMYNCILPKLHGINQL